MITVWARCNDNKLFEYYSSFLDRNDEHILYFNLEIDIWFDTLDRLFAKEYTFHAEIMTVITNKHKYKCNNSISDLNRLFEYGGINYLFKNWEIFELIGRDYLIEGAENMIISEIRNNKIDEILK